jgi:transporter family-2 protein
MTYWVFILVGIIGGIAAGLQASFTGIMGQKLGDLASVFITYCGGALVILVLVLLTGSSLNNWRSLPWYVFAAGPLGLLIIGSLSFTVPRLGAVVAVALFILAWLGFSALVDQFGWFGAKPRPLDSSRIFGIAALLLGAWLVTKS